MNLNEKKILWDIYSSDDFGSRLKYWRRRAGYTIKEFAMACNVSISYIGDYETKRRPNPGIYTLRKFIKAIIVSTKSKPFTKYLRGNKNEEC